MTTTDKLAVVGALMGRTKDISKAVRKMSTMGNALDKLTHDTGLAIIIASMPVSEGGHFDAGRALDYIKAVTAGGSRNRVVAWMHEFSNIRYSVKRNEDNSLTIKMRLLKMGDPEYKTARPVEADAKPYWALNNEGEPTPVEFTSLTFDRSLQAIIRRFEAAAARQGGVHDLLPKDRMAVDAIKRIATEVHARQEQARKAAPVAAPAIDMKDKPAKAKRVAARKVEAKVA